MMNAAYALNAYRQTKIETTSNPVDLIIMLYDGAVDSLEKAVTAINMKKVTIKLKYVDKALAIIEELNNSLNLEVGGEIALNLQDLYLYMTKELVLANIGNDVDKFNHIIGLLKDLREAWVQIKDQV